MERLQHKGVECEHNNAIIIPDTPDDNFDSPVKKRTKAIYPRLSYSDGGKSKASKVHIATGSSSVGAKRNLDKARYPMNTLDSSTNVVDLTTPELVGLNGEKPVVARVYTRRQPRIPTLNTRTTSAAFHDALLKLNDLQKSAIREIGFGSVLELKVRDLPGKLAYCVLNKFNWQTCQFEFDARRGVPVTENDVYRTFGFPRGERSIKLFDRTSTSDLFDQWFSFFGVDSRDKIKIGLVLKHMVGCKCGGTWFKRHFMIALGFSMFESRPNGTVHPYILDCLIDLRALRKWNWAEYMISSLKRYTESWMGDENKVYSGPALFLILFYVDRLSFPGLTSKRGFPILRIWSSDDLRMRQRHDLDKRNIGKGYIQEPLQLPSWYADDVFELEISDEEKELTNLLMMEANEISERMKKLSVIVDNAPVSAKKSVFFRKKVDEACQLTGMKIDIVIPDSKAPSPTIERYDDPIEYTEEFFVWLDKTSAEAIAEKKREQIRPDDIPAFDLGFTSDDPVHINQEKVSSFAKGSESPIMGLVAAQQHYSYPCHGGIKENAFAAKENNRTAHEIPRVGERKALSTIDFNVTEGGSQAIKGTNKLLHLRSSNFQLHCTPHGICTRLQLEKKEKQIGMYALHKDPGEQSEILFSYKDIMVRRHEMLSLKRGHSVHPTVINAWAIILNGDDHSRKEKIPKRFYASTDIHVDCVATVGESYEDKRQSFFIFMRHELKQYRQNPISLIDLLFFPVYLNSMYYAVCFDTIKQRLFILDSTVDPSEIESVDKYMEITDSFRSLLSDFLNSVNEDVKASIV